MREILMNDIPRFFGVLLTVLAARWIFSKDFACCFSTFGEKMNNLSQV
jgi:hypothetical protein